MNAVYVIGAEDTRGRRFQFAAVPRDEQHARTRAARAAVLVAMLCKPAEWIGGRVVVTEAVARSLVAVSRINVRSARVKGGAS